MSSVISVRCRWQEPALVWATSEQIFLMPIASVFRIVLTPIGKHCCISHSMQLHMSDLCDSARNAEGLVDQPVKDVQ